MSAPARRRHRHPVVLEPTSWVYFAQVGPYIKVGFSRNPVQRVRRMFNGATSGPLGTPRDLASRRLLRSIPGDKHDERCVHLALADFCVEREWFLDEPEVRAFVERVRPGEYPTVARPAGPYVHPLDLTPEAQADLDRIVSRAVRRRIAVDPSP